LRDWGNRFLSVEEVWGVEKGSGVYHLPEQPEGQKSTFFVWKGEKGRGEKHFQGGRAYLNCTKLLNQRVIRGD